VRFGSRVFGAEGFEDYVFYVTYVSYVAYGFGFGVRGWRVIFFAKVGRVWRGKA